MNGPVPRPVELSYIWGDSLAELHVEEQVRRAKRDRDVTIASIHWGDVS